MNADVMHSVIARAIQDATNQIIDALARTLSAVTSGSSRPIMARPIGSSITLATVVNNYFSHSGTSTGK